MFGVLNLQSSYQCRYQFYLKLPQMFTVLLNLIVQILKFTEPRQFYRFHITPAPKRKIV